MTNRKSNAPINVALLAPARRCNQACPQCSITELFEEPVHEPHLRPEHYAEFVDRQVAGAPIQSVGFLGYEVTLPESWPYVEAVFAAASRYRLRKTFVTNGMLLAKWSKRIDTLDPNQITVSLDGGSPEANDRIRGLPGAFAATTRSVERLLTDVPRMRSRLAIASTLHDRDNVESLQKMPALLNNWGISKWILSIGLRRVGTEVRLLPRRMFLPWLESLGQAANAAGVNAHLVDLAGNHLEKTEGIKVHPGSLDQVVRLDPTGAVRTGAALMQRYDETSTSRWTPA